MHWRSPCPRVALLGWPRMVAFAAVCQTAARSDEESALAAEFAKALNAGSESAVVRCVTPECAKRVPPAEILQWASRVMSSCGSVARTQLRRRIDNRRALFEFITTGEYAFPVLIVTDPAFPNRISHVRAWDPWLHFSSRRDILVAMKRLGAQSALCAAELTKDGLQPWLSIDDHRSYSVASIMKLYLLASLANEVGEHRRTWTDTLKLEEVDRSLDATSGIMHRWPAGTPLSLQAAAALMIGESDNTAADMILHALGREHVEAELRLWGHSDLDRTVPFLSTAEMFKLKYYDGGEMGRSYCAMGTTEKRVFLSNAVRKLTLAHEHFPSTPKPVLMENVGWFASARDVAEVMRHLWRMSSSDGSNLPLGLLAARAPDVIPDGMYDFAGVKLGKDAGVRAVACVVMDGGRWHVLVCVVNDPEQNPPESRLRALALGVLSCFGRSLE